MKLLKTEEFLSFENPNPQEFYRVEVLKKEDGFKDLGGLFAVLVPGKEVPYHYHQDRESVIIPISGEAIETVEGKEITLRPGDVICIQPGEKHGTINRSNEEFRYIEFFTCPPVGADFIEVKE
ncbi:MAG: cupin domain-containing protein [Deltaproteobacteria bacterium]|nr:cupin domain-containing protein [Deltaproteobacteria bacterium]MBW1919888.1 cupin domain-containing protein [Deltaproteobacteria bacterium]MBW1934220.1 cupin domain-containing protein [Deltaproteobacteria bacterium]MBW1976481.1 cupin domain-containing protein [Deltaproteobacteria bacterium]MBW2044240.1 cupin domain-containing protein [Deltaproteobacteria bacterium]